MGKRLSDKDVVKQVKRDVKEFDGWAGECRKEYKAGLDFIAGRQISKEDLKYLQDQNRPPVIFNRLLKFVDAVVGTEINNKMEVRYAPVEVSDAGATDLLSLVIDQKTCGSSEEETTEAFRDAVTVGMGWTQTRLDYLEDPEGKFVDEHVDPLEMGWDFRARKKNLSDARFVFRRHKKTDEEFKERWPDKAGLLPIGGADTVKDADLRSGRTEERSYHEDESDDFDDRAKNEVIHYQWRVVETIGHVVAHPDTGEQELLTDEQWEKLKPQFKAAGLSLPVSAAVKGYKYRQAFVFGEHLLEPVKEVQDYSYKAMTGKWDRNKGYWFGVYRIAKDPQEWANKFFSNMMHIMSSAGKGPMVEESAVPAHLRNKFEDDYSRPDRVKYLADGAISNGRIKDPPPLNLPSGLQLLNDQAISGVADTLGVSMEFLGMAGRTQAGVVERSRRQSGLAVLADFFNSRRGHIKATGKLKLALALKYLPDSAFVRIGGPAAQAYLPLLRKVDFARADVKVDEAPVAPDQKMAVWEIVSNMLPMLMKLDLPMQVWAELLRYSPFPASVTEKIVRALTAPNPARDKAQELDMAQKDADVKETLSKVILNQAKARAEAEPDMGTMMNARTQLQNAQLDAAKSQQDMAHEERRFELEQQGLEAKTTADIIGHMMKLQQIEASNNARSEPQR